MQRLVALMQMTYVGPPMIYYGTEAGMWGADDPCDRQPMVWADLTYDPQQSDPLGRPRQADPVEFDRYLFGFYRAAISFRHDNSALRHGTIEFVQADNQAKFLAFRRTDESRYAARRLESRRGRVPLEDSARGRRSRCRRFLRRRAISMLLRSNEQAGQGSRDGAGVRWRRAAVATREVSDEHHADAGRAARSTSRCVCAIARQLAVAVFACCCCLAAARRKIIAASSRSGISRGRPSASCWPDEIARFEAAHPDVHVRALYKETEELRSGFQAAALAGGGPELIYGPSDVLDTFQTMGIVQDMSPWFPRGAAQRFRRRCAHLSAVDERSDEERAGAGRRSIRQSSGAGLQPAIHQGAAEDDG